MMREEDKELVSVLMSVYNTDEALLNESINSILNQTYQNIELVIIDDCSTDAGTIECLDALTDSRIKRYRNEDNLGLTKSLITGVELCSGKYIARMDADDISRKDRIEKQIAYLKANDYHIIGSGYQLNPRFKFHKLVSMNIDELKIRLLFGNAGIVHSSAFWERDYLKQNNISYNPMYRRSQDYALWCECASKGIMIGVHPDTLIEWRVSDNQISKKYSDQQDECKQKIRLSYVRDNYNLDGVDVQKFVETVDDTLYLKSKKEIRLASQYLTKFSNSNKDIPVQELCLFWILQTFSRFRRSKKIDMFISRWFFRSLEPRCLRYIIGVLRDEVVIYT